MQKTKNSREEQSIMQSVLGTRKTMQSKARMYVNYKITRKEVPSEKKV